MHVEKKYTTDRLFESKPVVWLERGYYDACYLVFMAETALPDGWIGIAQPQDIVFERHQTSVAIPKEKPWIKMSHQALMSFYDSLTNELQKNGILPQNPTEIERTMLKESLADARGTRDAVIKVLGNPISVTAPPAGPLTSCGPDHFQFNYNSYNGKMEAQDVAVMLRCLGYEVIDGPEKTTTGGYMKITLKKMGKLDA